MDRNFRSIILIRGVPGSGKSTLGAVLSESGKYPVFSVDDFFTDANGNYKFDHLKNHLAYEQCRMNTERSMKDGIKKIFVDNTFTMDWEMDPYIKLASTYSYELFVITVENYHGSKNIHEIPEEQIEKMKSKYKVRL
jgi:predicted kinase